MEQKKPSFFKVMLGDFESQLRVPPEFVKNNLDVRRRSRSFILRRPAAAGDRRVWNVKAELSGEWWFLRGGWGRFVSENGVSVGDFLVFRYDGETAFDVAVFGLNCCEKDPPVADAAARDDEEDDDDGEAGELWGANVIGETRSGGPILTCRAAEVEAESALRAARAFKPSPPYFIAAYRRSRARHMTIPKPLAKECDLVKGILVALRDPEGSVWHVELHGRQDGRLDMMSGWSKFVVENSLTEGDVCVFEFVGGDTFQVHIFRG